MPIKRYLIKGETGFVGASYEDEVEIEYTDEADLKEKLDEHRTDMMTQILENVEVDIEEIEEDDEDY